MLELARGQIHTNSLQLVTLKHQVNTEMDQGQTVSVWMWLTSSFDMMITLYCVTEVASKSQHANQPAQSSCASFVNINTPTCPPSSWSKMQAVWLTELTG